MGPVNNKKSIQCIDELDLVGKVVFLRLDLNVPMKEGKITDETRIIAALPTLRYALDQKAKLVVASHLGRPKSSDDHQLSMEPIAVRLGELLDREVILVEEPSSEAPRALLSGLRPHQMILLENLRFDPGETKNKSHLPESVCKYADVYVNDAFGASHRAHSSIVGIPTCMKQKAMGFLMKAEVKALSQIVGTPQSPFVLVLGGAKVSDKVEMIENLLDKVDAFIIGGAMAYTFLAAQGVSVGDSLVEKEKISFARKFLERCRMIGKEIYLPVDHKIVPKFEATDKIISTLSSEIPPSHLGIDIGPQTQEIFSQVLLSAKTIFWNGPMGVFETPEYAQGTFAVAKALVESDAITVVGGGDSAAAIYKSGMADKITHVSTGGGASLEFLQGKLLPGLEALKG